ncbi:MAG: hypothetical protein ACYDH5_02490 [Acidimicrobiales bacterium]
MVLSRRLVPVVAGASLALVGAACGSTSASGPAKGSNLPNGVAKATAAKAEASVTSAISKATAVHMVTKVTQGGKTVTQVMDAGSISGRQTLQIAGGTATVVAVKKGAYLKATTPVLTSIFGLPSAEASKDSGRWLSFSPSSTQYKTLDAGVLVGSVAKELALTKVTKAPHAAIHGVQVVALKGTSPSPGTTLTLFIPVTGPLLPIGGTISASGVSGTMSFTKWSTPLTIAAPSKSTPFPAAPAPSTSTTAPPSGAKSG